jgi:hypothetical protein
MKALEAKRKLDSRRENDLYKKRRSVENEVSDNSVVNFDL